MVEEKKEKETPKKTELEKETPETLKAEKPEEKSEKKVETPEKSKELQSALAQKEHFREKFEKAQKELDELKKKPNIELPQAQNPMEVVRLAKALEGYNEKEIGFISRNATDKSIDGIIQATKDEWVKAGVQAMRDKVEKENQKLEPSTKISPSEKPIEKITEEDLRGMTVKQKEEYLAKRGWIKKRFKRE